MVGQKLRKLLVYSQASATEIVRRAYPYVASYGIKYATHCDRGILARPS